MVKDLSERLADGLDELQSKVKDLDAKIESCHGTECEILETQKKDGEAKIAALQQQLVAIQAKVEARFAELDSKVGEVGKTVSGIKFPEPVNMKDWLTPIEQKLNEVQKCVGDECTSLRAVVYSRLPEIKPGAPAPAPAQVVAAPATIPVAAPAAAAEAVNPAPAAAPAAAPGAVPQAPPPQGYGPRGGYGRRYGAPPPGYGGSPNYPDPRQKRLMIESARRRAEALARARATRDQMRSGQARAPAEEEESEGESAAPAQFQCPQCGGQIEPYAENCPDPECNEPLEWLQEETPQQGADGGEEQQ